MHEGETNLLCGTCLWFASKFCQNMKHLSMADMNMPGLRAMEVMRNIKPPDRLKHEISLPDMALVTRTPISQMNSVVGTD